MASKFRNAGQTCVSSNRILVQAGIYEDFVKLLRETVEKEIKSGDGMQQGVNQGPLINPRQFQRVCDMVEDAQGKGAKIVLGGGADPAGKLFYKPTILTELSANMDLYKDEIFGPVISVMRFQTEEVQLDFFWCFSIHSLFIFFYFSRKLSALPMTPVWAWLATSTPATLGSAGGWPASWRWGWWASTRGSCRAPRGPLAGSRSQASGARDQSTASTSTQRSSTSALETSDEVITQEVWVNFCLLQTLIPLILLRILSPSTPTMPYE